MLTLLFMILLLCVFGKILGFAVKAAWGVSKIVCTVILLPLALIAMVVVGLVKIALPVLVIIGLLSLCMPRLGR